MKRRKPIVAAIAAVSGGGKPAISRALGERLPNTKVLFFDDRDYDVDSGIDDICAWLENGADYNLWRLEPLADDIKVLLTDEELNLEYIIIDYPFAYKNKEIGQLIDCAIFVDTPLDIAMARRILRDYENESLEKINADMEWYLSNGRRAYLHMLETIKPDSDIVIDGAQPLTGILDGIIERLRKLRK